MAHRKLLIDMHLWVVDLCRMMWVMWVMGKHGVRSWMNAFVYCDSNQFLTDKISEGFPGDFACKFFLNVEG